MPNREIAGIKFENDERGKPVPGFTDGTPKIVQLIMKQSGGAIKSEKQAEYLILGFSILAIVISIFLFFNRSEGKKQKIEVSPGRTIIYPDDAPPRIQ